MASIIQRGRGHEPMQVTAIGGTTGGAIMVRGCRRSVGPSRSALGTAGAFAGASRSLSAPLLTSSPQVAESWSTLLLSSLTLPPGIIPEHGQFTLARALAYIESHLDSRLSATEIARVAGTSERQLYVLFARHLNSTPFAHIATLRLNRAIDLLCETALSITEIAHRVGYADQSALTHALKKNRDLTPATVRRSSRVR